jgi:hypothetical protein
VFAQRHRRSPGEADQRRQHLSAFTTYNDHGLYFTAPSDAAEPRAGDLLMRRPAERRDHRPAGRLRHRSGRRHRAAVTAVAATSPSRRSRGRCGLREHRAESRYKPDAIAQSCVWEGAAHPRLIEAGPTRAPYTAPTAAPAIPTTSGRHARGCQGTNRARSYRRAGGLPANRQPAAQSGGLLLRRSRDRYHHRAGRRSPNDNRRRSSVLNDVTRAAKYVVPAVPGPGGRHRHRLRHLGALVQRLRRANKATSASSSTRTTNTTRPTP